MRIKQLFFFFCFLLLPVIGQAEEISYTDLLEIVRAEKGKIVFVNFFATWCPPCLQEIPDLITLRQEFSEQDLKIIGISLDETPEKLASFESSMHFNYPIYKAKDDIPVRFGVQAIPLNLIYDSNGKLGVREEGMADITSLRTLFQKLIKK